MFGEELAFRVGVVDATVGVAVLAGNVLVSFCAVDAVVRNLEEFIYVEIVIVAGTAFVVDGKVG